MASKTGDQNPIEAGAITPRQWVIFAACLVTMMFDGYDIALMSFVAPAVADEWSLPASQLGIVFSAALMGMGLGAMLVAPLADKFGRRIVMSSSLMLVGVTTVACSYATDTSGLAIMRFLSGIGLGTLVAVVPTYASEYSPTRHRNILVSSMMCATSVGGITGGLVSAPLIVDIGWQTLFFYVGLIVVALAVIVYLSIPESIKYLAGKPSQGNLDKINKILRDLGHEAMSVLPEVNASVASESATLKTLLSPRRRIMTIIIWLAFFFAFATSYFLSSWLPKLLVNSGFSIGNSIRITVIFTVGTLVGGLLFSWLSKHWKLNNMISLSFVAGFFLMLFWSYTIHFDVPAILTWIVLACLGFCINGAFINLYAVVINVYPAHIRSTGLGWGVGVGRMGAVLSPVLAGFLLSVGVSTMGTVLIFSVPLLLAAAFIWFVRGEN